ncbi:hypothetical protein XH87_01020 [Bradyrhizobium sp. CCBAU 53415]|nr:hypothetical protein [Bradyrhizobium sp. CCBAU 53415]
MATTPHGGAKPISGRVKAIAIKTPPQAPDDVKLLDCSNGSRLQAGEVNEPQRSIQPEAILL